MGYLSGRRGGARWQGVSRKRGRSTRAKRSQKGVGWVGLTGSRENRKRIGSLNSGAGRGVERGRGLGGRAVTSAVCTEWEGRYGDAPADKRKTARDLDRFQEGGTAIQSSHEMVKKEVRKGSEIIQRSG